MSSIILLPKIVPTINMFAKLFSLNADIPEPSITISDPSHTSSTQPITVQAGMTLELTCQVSVVENLVSPPTVSWRGGSIGSDHINVEEIDNMVVKLMFNPLHTSHGAQYTCFASIEIDSIGVTSQFALSKEVRVQSKCFL